MILYFSSIRLIFRRARGQCSVISLRLSLIPDCSFASSTSSVTMSVSLAQLFLSPLHLSQKTPPSPAALKRRTRAVAVSRQTTISHRLAGSCSIRHLGLHGADRSSFWSRGRCSVCFYNANEDKLQEKESELDWPILKRWDVPWKWQTVSLASLACGLSFILTGLIETAAIPYLGLQITDLSLDEKAEILFVDQAITTAVVLGVLYSLTNTFQPRDDLYRYDLREPFNLKKGWLLWAGIGLTGAVVAIALTGAAMSLFNGEAPRKETDALVRLLPLIGSSSISTACLIGITGVLAPFLEENVFRGFLMVSLTQWLPTPVSVLISAAVFAVAHLTPGEFPQLFVLGIALGFSYAQTRNLLTPITIHALWNSGVILLLTFLQLQGYDIKELLQAS